MRSPPPPRSDIPVDAATAFVVVLVVLAGAALAARVPAVPAHAALWPWVPLLLRFVLRRGLGAIWPTRWRRATTYLSIVLVAPLWLASTRVTGPDGLATFLVGVGAVQAALLLAPASRGTIHPLLGTGAAQVVAASFVLASPLDHVLHVVFLILLGWAVLVVQRDRSIQATAASDRRRLQLVGEGRPPLVHLGKALLFLALLAVPAALCAFVAAPKDPLGGLATEGEEVAEWLGGITGRSGNAQPAARGRPTFADDAQSGRVAFGAIDRIRRNATPLFRVWHDPQANPHQSSFLLRESALDRFSIDGSWDAPATQTEVPLRFEADAEGRIRFPFRAARSSAHERERELVVEILWGRHARLFLEPEEVEMRLERRAVRWRDWSVERRVDGVHTASLLLQEGDRLVQRSRPQPRSGPRLERARSDADTSPSPAYLQLPTDIAERALALATPRVAGMNSPWMRAKRLEAWLRSSDFVYTLALPALDPHDPIGDFLFRARRGHCACFASALCVMLRSLGMPARWVRGFRGGDLSVDGRSTVVRASHYHAWVELHLDGVGWVPLDPTPPEAMAEEVRARTAAADEGTDGESPVDSLAGRFARWLDGLGNGLWLGIAAVLLVVLAWMSFKGAATGGGAAGPRRSAGVPAGALAEAMRLATRAGIRRKPGATAREWLGLARARLPAAGGALRVLVLGHERAHYAGRPPEPPAPAAIAAVADAVEAWRAAQERS